MTQAIRAAEAAIVEIRRQLTAATLARTTYCALVMTTPTGLVAIVAEAGAGARGLSAHMVTLLEGAIGIPVIAAAAPTAREHGFHVNDAERQALAVWATGYSNCRIEFVMATRAICETCSSVLQNQGLRVLGDRAARPTTGASASGKQ
jgi:hypothetical protein